jgi:hypothetical protein
MIKKDENMKWGEGEKQKKKKITYIPLSQWGKHRDKFCNKTLWEYVYSHQLAQATACSGTLGKTPSSSNK